MPELQFIYKKDGSGFFHSFSPNGTPLWTDHKEQMLLMSEEQSDIVYDMLLRHYKRADLELEIL